MPRPADPRWLPRRVLHGEDEPIFSRLSADLISNLRSPTSEAALVWNTFYPRARPTLSLRQWLTVRPLAGTQHLDESDDQLQPFFWGWSVDGERLSGLDQALVEVDGSDAAGWTEADLILWGHRTVIVVEAKHQSGFGRCGRHEAGRCPEVHGRDRDAAGCRYWADTLANFDLHLEFGSRPQAGGERPPCAQHYQLARLLLLATRLAEDRRVPHLWAVVPRRRWAALQREWDDFARRVRDEALWKRLRVLAWEDVPKL
jgi:hypothetical protein